MQKRTNLRSNLKKQRQADIVIIVCSTATTGRRRRPRRTSSQNSNKKTCPNCNKQFPKEFIDRTTRSEKEDYAVIANNIGWRKKKLRNGGEVEGGDTELIIF